MFVYTFLCAKNNYLIWNLFPPCMWRLWCWCQKKDKSEFSNYRVGEHCYARKINRTFSCQLISRQHRYSRIIQLERKAIKIPRIEVSDCKRDDIQEPGVYFLFCKDEGNDEDSVYIGEAENVKDRLLQHLRDVATEK